MVVQELIEELKKFPSNLPVKVNYEDVDNVYLNTEFYDGDCNNPKCPVITVVEIK